MDVNDAYAGLGRRAIAFIIDIVLLIMVLRTILFRPNTFPGLIDWSMVGLAVLIVVYELFLVFFLGATIGKFAVGVRVVDAQTGQRPSLIQCAIRPVAKIALGLWVINLAITLFVAFAFTVLNVAKLSADAERRALHDIAARTAVIKSRVSRSQISA